MNKNQKSILILGANGFIGNALVKDLCNDGTMKIYGMDIENNKLDHSLGNPNFVFEKGDINSSDKWIKDHIKKCDIIVPLVAIATPNVYVKDPLKIFQLDFESNLKIIKWVAEYNKRVIFPSTSEVYGITSDKEFNEYTTNLTVGPVHKSRWIYSVSKQLLDRIIIAYGEKGLLDYTIFRPFNWIGPRLDSLKLAQLGNGRVLSIFIYNLLNNKDLIVVGDGNQSRSFTYIDDGIDALKRIIYNSSGNDLNKKIFNIGNPDNNININNLAKILIEEYNKIYPKNFTGKITNQDHKIFYGEGYEDIPVRVPDIREAKKILNWAPKYDLKMSIRETLNSFIKEKENNKL
ncbi:MAG: NAD-dependent epimerase/dehydratase family protein [Pelagibacteraceae bacterium]|nr:NAD-dependent epimerase/dehydratase family protein [Pelagibacteraceae bacterium]|tara:strand:- start:9954 stop:10994 length:1041 start_codon:yes stop_codon:yes gene_type:complete